MQYLLLLILLFTSVGCTTRPVSMYADRVKVQANTEDLSALVWDYTIELEHEKRLRLENSYVVSGNGYSAFRMQFSSQDLLEVGPARKLLVDVVEGFLNKLNADPVAYEMLPYPFDADHMEVYIDFQSFHGEFVDPYFVGWAVLEHGMAYYYAFDLKNRKKDFWHSRIEPYEKSRSYVEFERAAELNYQLSHPQATSRLQEDRYRGNIVQ